MLPYKIKYDLNGYGNVKSACAFLYGLSAELLDTSELDYYDEKYPLILGLKIFKHKQGG
ncbi:hypothetical protein [Butyrivibrio sp. NC3005]|uniref:hypothetical protein n=1 Tax=Butyrivibrio sp. NC3005 TaxID=1280685 RepID=UPI000401A083|nr:hypothetical protein [Butyrivibrio sp. NC3005]